MASPAPAAEPRWLLIGNSRWHWAAPPLASGAALRVWHTRPVDGARSGPEGGGTAGLVPALAKATALDEGIDALAVGSAHLLGWAAVGPVPVDLPLSPEVRLKLADVPLQAAPPWLGIDRALAGWWGWRLVAAPVLVVDAGTALSLTRVDRGGRFAGGRLMAGASLQLRAMAGGTAHLPPVAAPGGSPEAAPPPPWPHDTGGAMRSGVLRGLAAAIAAAAREARREEPDCRLLLTGGDSAALANLLHHALTLEQRPHLCLEALAALRPAVDQPRARSLRI